MPAEADRLEAGGHERDLRRIIDEVEAGREEELRSSLGRGARGGIVSEMKAEIVRRFEEAHPGVKPRFLTGPYRDPGAPRGQRGRKR